MGIMVVLSGGYTMARNKNIRVDVLVEKCSEKTRLLLELISAPLVFFVVLIMLWKIFQDTVKSVGYRETFTSHFAPPVWPLKIVIVAGIFLVFLQVVATFIRNLEKYHLLDGSQVAGQSSGTGAE
jgi:TRAP-type mannitol/chloroaromatic compound transport system permease small subunit